MKTSVAVAKVAQAAEGLSYAEVVRACDEAIKFLLLEGRSDLKTADLLAALEERRTFLNRPPL